jgi:hypothetical protein
MVNYRILYRILLLTLSLWSVSPALASNAVYLGNAAAGANDGTSCANAKIYTYFNSSGNWSATPTGIQIGPDTTVHLCGTIDVAANTTALTFQGSGTSGHPVTLLWETNAILESPAFPSGSGGITTGSQSYIVIDGGANGIMQNTSNGSSGFSGCLVGTCTQQIRTSQMVTTALDFSGSNITVKNLNVKQVFMMVKNSTDPLENGDTNTVAVAGIVILASNSRVTNSYVDNAYNGIFGAGTSTELDHNTVRWVAHGIVIGQIGGGTSESQCGSIHDNDFSNTGGGTSGKTEWSSTASSNPYHLNYIFAFTGSAGKCDNLKIYNNYGHGLQSNNTVSRATSAIFVESSGYNFNGACCVFPNVKIFNNVMEFDSPGNATNIPNFVFNGVGEEGSILANNTVLQNYEVSGAGQGSAFGFNTAGESNLGGFFTSIQSYNNLFIGNSGASLSGPAAGTVPKPYTVSMGTDTGYVENNVYADPASSNAFACQDGNVNDFSHWDNYNYAGTSTCGFDQYGLSTTSSAVNLNTSTFVPGTGSVAIGAGKNLTSLCSTTPELCNDKNGTSRPSMGAWDVGAIQANGASLTFTVQPTNTITSHTMSPSVVVTDSDNTFSGTITLTINGCGASASNNTATASSGVGTFASLGMTGTGNTCTFTASATGANSQASASFNVTSGATGGGGRGRKHR